MLDLSTFGPAVRATRLLADYGARVVKVGPVPSADASPGEPEFFAYSGHRGMHRVLLDLKDDDGREAFLALAAAADVVVESFRPGVVDRLGIGYAAVSARNPGIVYCSTTGYGQDGPHAQWAGHDIDYLAVGGFLGMSTPGEQGAPPLPGRHHRRRRRRWPPGRPGHHGRPGRPGRDAVRGAYLDVSVAEGVLWLMSLAIDEQLALGGDIEPGHDVLSGRYACYATYQASDGRWLAVGAIEARFFANLCAALGCPELARLPVRGGRAARNPRRLRPRLRHPEPRRVGRGPGRRRHLRRPRARGGRGGRRPAVPRPGRGGHGHPPDAGHLSAAGAAAGGDGPHRSPDVARHDRDRHRAPPQGGWGGRRDRGPLGRTQGGGMSKDPLSVALELVDKEQYHEVGEFPVERGYVWTSCASVENGNPLFWDDAVATALTGGSVAPPSMVSVWFRPHHWAPGRKEEALPLQVHFDLKALFGLPEAVMTDNTIEFHEPVRMGDRLRTHQVLRSVSEEKTTKLGTGRFWVIDVVYTNQDEELVAVESYTGFGYRRGRPHDGHRAAAAAARRRRGR